MTPKIFEVFFPISSKAIIFFWFVAAKIHILCNWCLIIKSLFCHFHWTLGLTWAETHSSITYWNEYKQTHNWDRSFHFHFHFVRVALDWKYCWRLNVQLYFYNLTLIYHISKTKIKWTAESVDAEAIELDIIVLK